MILEPFQYSIFEKFNDRLTIGPLAAGAAFTCTFFNIKLLARVSPGFATRISTAGTLSAASPICLRLFECEIFACDCQVLPASSERRRPTPGRELNTL